MFRGFVEVPGFCALGTPNLLRVTMDPYGCQRSFRHKQMGRSDRNAFFLKRVGRSLEDLERPTSGFWEMIEHVSTMF